MRAKAKVRFWLLFYSKFLPKLSGRGTSLLPQLWCWASGCPQPWPALVGGEELPSLCLFLLQVGRMLRVPGNRDFMAHLSQAAIFACSGLCSPAALVVLPEHMRRQLIPITAWTLKHFGLVGIKLFVWVSERGKQSNYLACGGKVMLLMKAVFLLQ